jgi:hypothetical protein
LSSGIVAGSFEDADGEHEEGGDEREDSREGDANEAEGETDHPDDGVEDEREQGKRPAEDEKDAKEEESDHDKGYDGWVRKVP